MNRIFYYAYGILMIGVYLGMGYLLAFTLLFNNFSPYMTPLVRYMLGALLILYGLFRAYRLFGVKKYKNQEL